MKSTRTPTGLVFAALIGTTVTFYYGLWLPGLVLIKRDAFRFHPPLKQYLAERLSAGELPQWFPYEGLGRSFIGVTVTGVFHPFTALYTVLSVPDAYRLSTLLCCLLAALGAFVLGRRLGFSRAGAVLSGAAFALSGYVVSLTDNLTFLYSVCLLPLFCAGLERARHGFVWTVPASALWASVFLIGDAQTGYYYGFIAFLWMLVRGSGSYLSIGGRLLVIAGLTMLLSGLQLGPTWSTFMNSNRMHPEQFRDQALYWSTHPLRLMTVLASPIGQRADPVDVGEYFFGNRPMEGKGGQWAESLYLGAPLLGLAVLGAWSRRDVRVLAWLGGAALLLALGRYGGLYEIFYRVVPYWSAFRYPEKLMGVVSFSLAMLGGAGLDAVRQGKGGITPWLVFSIIFACVGLLLSTEAVRGWSTAHWTAPPGLIQEMTGSGAQAFFYSAVAALGLWLIILSVRRGWLRETSLGAIVIILVILDLSRVNLGSYYTVPRDVALFTPPLAQAIADREKTGTPGRFRIFLLSEPLLVMPEAVSRRLGHHGAASLARRQALEVEHNAQFHIEAANFNLPGNSPALALMLKPSSAEVPGAARYNVAYYIGRRSRLEQTNLAPGLVAGLRSYDLGLFQSPVAPFPRVYLSRNPERADPPVDPAALLARSDFLNGDVDVIDSTLPIPGPASDGTATIERYAPEDIQVRVASGYPAVLVLLDAYEKGWTASLDDGVSLPILRANALTRAVAVPAGDHVVAFHYETPYLRLGAAASLTGVMLCLGFLWPCYRRPRPTEAA